MKLFDLFTALPASTSTGGTINWLDVKKLLRLALVGAVGMFLVNVAGGLSGIEFGAMKPVADLLGVLFAELGRRMLAATPQA